ncbi:MAG: hypothetical protein R2733_17445 [Acidimicrobiales bacterium]
MTMPTDHPHRTAPALCAWSMLAALVLAVTFGLLAALQTATVACRYHTVDACIPVLEPLFGLIGAAAIFTWLATSPRRHRSTVSGLKLAALGIALWAALNVSLAPVMCPDPGRNDVICHFALPVGAASFVVIAAIGWPLQRREPDRDSDDHTPA